MLAKYKLLIFALMIIFLVGIADATLTDNLVAYWKLDESSLPLNSEVNGYKFNESVNTPSMNTGGLIGTSVYTEYVSVGNGKYFKGNHSDTFASNTFSVSFWFNASAAVNGGFLSYGQAYNENFAWHCYSPGNRYLFCCASVNGHQSGAVCGQSAGTFGLNAWHHVVYVVNGSSQKGVQYIDGQVDNRTAGISDVFDTPDRLYMGAYYNLGYVQTTHIDEIGFWDRALTGDEVTELYNGGAGLAYPFSVAANPPTINTATYNVSTAYQNATAWRVSPVNYVYVKDNTPTVKFDLDMASNCSIGLTDQNYSTMVVGDANTKCSATETTSMTCTMPSSQGFVSGDDQLYIACKDTTNLVENVTSTSGALNIRYILPNVCINQTNVCFTNLTDAMASGGNGYTYVMTVPTLNESVNINWSNIIITSNSSPQTRISANSSAVLNITGNNVTLQNFAVSSMASNTDLGKGHIYVHDITSITLQYMNISFDNTAPISYYVNFYNVSKWMVNSVNFKGVANSATASRYFVFNYSSNGVFSNSNITMASGTGADRAVYTINSHNLTFSGINITSASSSGKSGLYITSGDNMSIFNNYVDLKSGVDALILVNVSYSNISNSFFRTNESTITSYDAMALADASNYNIFYNVAMIAGKGRALNLGASGSNSSYNNFTRLNATAWVGGDALEVKYAQNNTIRESQLYGTLDVKNYSATWLLNTTLNSTPLYQGNGYFMYQYYTKFYFNDSSAGTALNATFNITADNFYDGINPTYRLYSLTSLDGYSNITVLSMGIDNGTGSYNFTSYTINYTANGYQLASSKFNITNYNAPTHAEQFNFTLTSTPASGTDNWYTATCTGTTPPASGNWTIKEDTSCINGIIVIKDANISIDSGINFNLTNVNMSFNLTSSIYNESRIKSAGTNIVIFDTVKINTTASNYTWKFGLSNNARNLTVKYSDLEYMALSGFSMSSGTKPQIQYFNNDIITNSAPYSLRMVGAEKIIFNNTQFLYNKGSNLQSGDNFTMNNVTMIALTKDCCHGIENYGGAYEVYMTNIKAINYSIFMDFIRSTAFYAPYTLYVNGLNCTNNDQCIHLTNGNHTNVYLNNLWCDNNNAECVKVEATGSNHITVNNSISYNGDTPFFFYIANNIRLNNLTIYNNLNTASGGIALDQTNNSLVTNINCYNNNRSCIMMSEGNFNNASNIISTCDHAVNDQATGFACQGVEMTSYGNRLENFSISALDFGINIYPAGTIADLPCGNITIKNGTIYVEDSGYYKPAGIGIRRNYDNTWGRGCQYIDIRNVIVTGAIHRSGYEASAFWLESSNLNNFSDMACMNSQYCIYATDETNTTRFVNLSIINASVYSQVYLQNASSIVLVNASGIDTANWSFGADDTESKVYVKWWRSFNIKSNGTALADVNISLVTNFSDLDAFALENLTTDASGNTATTELSQFKYNNTGQYNYSWTVIVNAPNLNTKIYYLTFNDSGTTSYDINSPPLNFSIIYPFYNSPGGGSYFTAKNSDGSTILNISSRAIDADNDQLFCYLYSGLNNYWTNSLVLSHINCTYMSFNATDYGLYWVRGKVTDDVDKHNSSSDQEGIEKYATQLRWQLFVPKNDYLYPNATTGSLAILNANFTSDLSSWGFRPGVGTYYYWDNTTGANNENGSMRMTCHNASNTLIDCWDGSLRDANNQTLMIRPGDHIVMSFWIKANGTGIGGRGGFDYYMTNGTQIVDSQDTYFHNDSVFTQYNVSSIARNQSDHILPWFMVAGTGSDGCADPDGIISDNTWLDDLTVYVEHYKAIDFSPDADTDGSTVPRYYVYVNISIDETFLSPDRIYLEWNGVNETIAVGNYTFNKTVASAGVYTMRLYANESKSGSSKSFYETELRSITVSDGVVPSSSNPQVNKTPVYKNDWIQLNMTWSDDTSLSGYVFSTNQSSSWVNSTFTAMTGTEDIATNISKVILEPYSIFYWMYYANDTSNQWNESLLQSLMVDDNIGPSSSDWAINNTGPKYNDVILLNMTWNDPGNLTAYVLYTNITGNLSWQPMTSKTNYSNYTIKINVTRGSNVSFIYYANDSKGNINKSLSNSIIVANTAPSIATINLPSNQTNFTTYGFEVNITAADSDNDALIYYTYVNGSFNGTEPTANFTYNFTDGYYYIEVLAGDGYDNATENSSAVYIFIDGTKPSITAVGNNNTAPKINEVVSLNTSWQDNINPMAYYWFWSNMTGINSTASLFNSNNDAFINYTVTVGRGSTVGWKGYANDSYGNINETVLQTFTVANTAPSIAYITGPLNNSNLSYPIEINWTANDSDADELLVYLYINSTYNSSSNRNFSLNFPTGTWFIELLASDSYGNATANSTVVYFNSTLVDGYPSVTGIVNYSITSSSVAINYTSDQAANSSINYGTSASLGSYLNNATSASSTWHIILDSLSSSTLYYYNISACNAISNCNISGPFSFTTSSIGSSIGGGGDILPEENATNGTTPLYGIMYIIINNGTRIPITLHGNYTIDYMTQNMKLYSFSWGNKTYERTYKVNSTIIGCSSIGMIYCEKQSNSTVKISSYFSNSFIATNTGIAIIKYADSTAMNSNISITNINFGYIMFGIPVLALVILLYFIYKLTK